MLLNVGFDSPIASKNPLRIEFWGDKIDSIREFETLSQRSIKEYNEVEFIANLFSDEKQYDVSMFDYLPNNTLIVFDEPNSLNQEIIINNSKNISNFHTLDINPLSEADVNIKIEQLPAFNSSIKTVCDELEKFAHYSHTILLSADGKASLKRLRELIESELENRNKLDFIQKSIIWRDTVFSKGFIGI